MSSHPSSIGQWHISRRVHHIGGSGSVNFPVSSAHSNSDSNQTNESIGLLEAGHQLYSPPSNLPISSSHLSIVPPSPDISKLTHLTGIGRIPTLVRIFI